MIWEIQTSERAEELLGGCVVGPRRFYFGIKILALCLPYSGHGSADTHTPRLLAVGARKPNALVFVARDAVGVVLRARTEPKIFAAIVEAVAVYMVNHLPSPRTQQEAVQQCLRPGGPDPHVGFVAVKEGGVQIPTPDDSDVRFINETHAPISQFDFTNRRHAFHQ